MANKKLLRFSCFRIRKCPHFVSIGCNGKQIGVFVYIAGKIYLRYLEKKLSIQRTRYTIITPAMTILIIRTNIIYRIKDLFLWNNNV